jgi:hypothetical protein
MTMKLHVDFEDALIKKYAERGQSPIFTIYWTEGEAAYPAERWLDFGSVVLSWWLVAAKSLLEGATEAEFSFMDGPYCLRASRIVDLLYFSVDDQSWQGRIPVEVFAAELVKAARQVQNKLAKLNISDKEGLHVGIQHLQSSLSQAKVKTVGKHVAMAETIS